MRSPLILLLALLALSQTAKAAGPHDPRPPQDLKDNTPATQRSPAPGENCVRKSCSAEEWKEYIEGKVTEAEKCQRCEAIKLIEKTGMTMNSFMDFYTEARSKELKPKNLEAVIKTCATEASTATKLNCLRQKVQIYLKDENNIPDCQLKKEKTEGAECETHSHTFVHAAKELFKADPSLSFKVRAINLYHAVPELTYVDPKTGKEYVYFLEASYDRGEFTDLMPSNATAKNEPLPDKFLNAPAAKSEETK